MINTVHALSPMHPQVTGRQPNPEQQWYDAYLYASFLPGPAGPEPSYAMQWAGGVLGVAAAPFRSAWGNCMQLPAWLGRCVGSRAEHHCLCA